MDTLYFEPARLLALQGVSLLFSPMCNKVTKEHSYAYRPSYYSHFVARSFENRLWLVSADWIWPFQEGLICPGHSVIYDPNGRERARSTAIQEQLLIFDIPLDELNPVKGRRVHGSPKLAQAVVEASWNLLKK